MEDNIAGIPIEDLKPLAIKYEGNDSFESLQKVALKISVANCARISYKTLGDNPKIDYKKDIELYDRLLSSRHASPMEHCAVVPTNKEYFETVRGRLHFTKEVNRCESGWFNNFKGFKQLRYIIENEK